MHYSPNEWKLAVAIYRFNSILQVSQCDNNQNITLVCNHVRSLTFNRETPSLSLLRAVPYIEQMSLLYKNI